MIEACNHCGELTEAFFYCIICGELFCEKCINKDYLGIDSICDSCYKKHPTNVDRERIIGKE